jgi:hypothetical protein
MEHKQASTKDAAAAGAESQRMRLRYCERCGALRVCPAEAADPLCPLCARFLNWIHQEVPDVPGQL